MLNQRPLNDCRSAYTFLRWVALALDEASKTFRKLRSHQGMPKLVAGLRAHDALLETKAIDGIYDKRISACIICNKTSIDKGFTKNFLVLQCRHRFVGGIKGNLARSDFS